MNLKEAYSILEIPSTATPEEAKKKYRELTKKYHPDVNKEAGAEDKFKKINEAYQVVSSGKSTDKQEQYAGSPFGGNPFGGSPFGGNPFGRQSFIQLDNIDLSTDISFKDSVLGCKKNIKFGRKSKCQPCDGQGQYQLNNGCSKCGGRGQITMRQGAMVVVKTCDQCYGKTQIESCKECQGMGVVDAEVAISVTIPGGIVDGNVLRLGGMGHFTGSFGPFEQHTDVHLRVRVEPDPHLKIDGQNVISSIDISLLEALAGCKKTVYTIMGDKDINIPPRSKNKEEVVIPRLGVNGRGNQKVILNVKYPDNIDKLISTLSEIN